MTTSLTASLTTRLHRPLPRGLGAGLAALLLCTPATARAQGRNEARAAIAARLSERVAERLAGDTALVAVALVDPASGLRFYREADRRVHAASTMKVPVLIELARRADAGELRWDDSLLVRNEFPSIVDGSPFRLDPADDSDSTLYALEGRRVPIRRLAELMIDRSSNLATNLLIARLDPRRVQATAIALGADSMEIRRGVEDGKAYAAGLNNTTTARALATLMLAIADGRAASPGSGAEILRILSAQEFNDRIPAGLPPGTRVAHKTGEITGIAHDAAIVYPTADPRPYVLVVLTRGYADAPTASAAIAEVARAAHAAVMDARRRAPAAGTAPSGR